MQGNSQHEPDLFCQCRVHIEQFVLNIISFTGLHAVSAIATGNPGTSFSEVLHGQCIIRAVEKTKFA
jgi:hypothetical protein